MIQLFLLALLSLSDPIADVVGAGNLEAPTGSAQRVLSAYDLQAVELSDGSTVGLTISLGSLSNPYQRANGFSLPIVEVYVQDNGRAGSTGLLPGSGMVLPEGSSWRYAVRATGDAITLFEYRNGQVVDVSSALQATNIQGSSLLLSSTLAKPRSAQLFALVGAYDPFSETGWREISRAPSQWAFSSEVSALPVVDVLAGSEAAQTRALNTGVLPSVSGAAASNSSVYPFVMILGLLVMAFGIAVRFFALKNPTNPSPLSSDGAQERTLETMEIPHQPVKVETVSGIYPTVVHPASRPENPQHINQEDTVSQHEAATVNHVVPIQDARPAAPRSAFDTFQNNSPDLGWQPKPSAPTEAYHSDQHQYDVTDDLTDDLVEPDSDSQTGYQDGLASTQQAYNDSSETGRLEPSSSVAYEQARKADLETSYPPYGEAPIEDETIDSHYTKHVPIDLQSLQDSIPETHQDNRLDVKDTASPHIHAEPSPEMASDAVEVAEVNAEIPAVIPAVIPAELHHVSSIVDAALSQVQTPGAIASDETATLPPKPQPSVHIEAAPETVLHPSERSQSQAASPYAAPASSAGVAKRQTSDSLDSSPQKSRLEKHREKRLEVIDLSQKMNMKDPGSENPGSDNLDGNDPDGNDPDGDNLDEV